MKSLLARYESDTYANGNGRSSAHANVSHTLSKQYQRLNQISMFVLHHQTFFPPQKETIKKNVRAHESAYMANRKTLA